MVEILTDMGRIRRRQRVQAVRRQTGTTQLSFLEIQGTTCAVYNINLNSNAQVLIIPSN